MLSLHFHYLQSELFFTCKDLISSLFFFSVVLFSFHYSLIYKQQECTTENKQKKIRFQEDAWIWKAKISSLRKRRTAFWSLLDVIDKNIKKKKIKQRENNQPSKCFQFFFFSLSASGPLNTISGVPFLSNTILNPQCTLSSLITE